MDRDARTLLRIVIAATAALALLLSPAPAAALRTGFVHRVAPSYPAGRKIVIEGRMLGASEVDVAEVIFRSNATDGWVTLELELISGDHYRVEIPAAKVQPPHVEYYVVAIDFLEERHPAHASEAQPAVLTVTPAPADTAQPDDDDAEPDAGTTALDGGDPADTETDDDGPIERVSLVDDGDEEPVRVDEKGRDLIDKRSDRDAPGRRRRARPSADAGTAPSGAGAVTVIGRDQIRQMGARHLVDILLAVGELDIIRTVTGDLRISLRGSESDGDVLLTVDGMTFVNPYSARALLTIPAHLVERVTVRIGAAVGVAQIGALAGSVDVTMRQAEGVDVTVHGGSFASHLTADNALRYGTYNAGLVAGHRFGSMILSGFFHFDVSDGSQATIGRDAFSGTGSGLSGALSDAPGPAIDNHLGLSGGVTARFVDMPGELTVGARYFFDDRGGNIGLTDTYGPSSGVGEHALLAAVSHHIPLGDNRSLNWRAAFDLHQSRRRFQLTPIDFSLADRNGDEIREDFADGVIEQQSFIGWRTFAEVTAEIEITPGQVLTSGVVFIYEDSAEPQLMRNIDELGVATALVAVPRTPPAAPLGGLTRIQLAAHVDDSWQMHRMFNLTMGLRFTYVSDLNAFEVQKAIGPRLVLSFAPIESLNFRLLYASSFRPPSMVERTDQTITTLPEPLQSDRYVGDPRLRSPGLHTVELRTTWASSRRGVRYFAEIGAHYARLIDGIAEVPEVGTADVISTRPGRDQVGLSARGSLHLEDGTYFFAAGWWYRTTDTTPATDAALLTAIPQVGAVAGVHVPILDTLELTFAARFQGERRNNGRSVLERIRNYRIPASFVVDAAIHTVPIFDLLRFGVTGHNLFDVDRRDPAPRPDAMPELVPNEGMLILGTIELLYESGGGES